MDFLICQTSAASPAEPGGGNSHFGLSLKPGQNSCYDLPQHEVRRINLAQFASL